MLGVAIEAVCVRPRAGFVTRAGRLAAFRSSLAAALVCWWSAVAYVNITCNRPNKSTDKMWAEQTKKCTWTVEDTSSLSFHAGDRSNPRARIVASVIILNSFQAVVPPSCAAVLKIQVIIDVYCAHHHWSTALLLLVLSTSQVVSTNELLMYWSDVSLLS